jgi:hypothetical protein
MELPQLSNYELLGIVFILWLMSQGLKPILSRIECFGFKVETTNDFDMRISNDISVKDSIAMQIEEVDRRCRRSMCNALNGIIRRFINEYPDKAQIILDARYELATSICDNHIAREFAESIQEYYQSVQHEVVNIQSQWIDGTSREILMQLVKEWIASIVSDVRDSSTKKNAIYRENMAKLKVQINRDVCISKIAKNQMYLEAIEKENTSTIANLLIQKA